MSRQLVLNFWSRTGWKRLGQTRINSILTLATIGFGLLLVPITDTQAAEGESINITSLNISPVSDSDKEHIVFLRGTFKNTTSQLISKVELNLVSTMAIKSRSELAGIVSDPTSANDLIPSSIFAVLRNVAPGTSKNWQITFRGEEVLSPIASGVYGFGVQPSIPDQSLATVITTPWFYNSSIKPTNVSLVIPLTTLNLHLANGEISDRRKDVAEIARLTNLISNQDASKVSWLQDPALYLWLSQLDLETDSDKTEQLKTALASLPSVTPILPYGHADLTALMRANKQDDLAAAISQTRQGFDDNTIFYAPVRGIADRQTVSLLNQQGIRTLISNEFLRGNQRETTAAVSNSASNEVLVHDLGASKCLDKADLDDANFFAAMTCIKSEIGMMTAESPQNSRSVIVLTPTNWRLSSERLTILVSALSDNSWMQLTTLDLVAATKPTQNYVATQSAEPREFSRTLIRQSENLKLDTESVSALYDDQELAASFTAARILGFSDLWPSNARATQYLGANRTLLDDYLDAVSIQASTRITTSKESSEIPITVLNESDSSVSLSVNLSSAAASRFSAEPSGIIQVGGGQRVTIPISINLVGAGVVDVQAHLIAPNGEPFGEVENIQITSAEYGQFARTLVSGAFGLLVLLAISNFVKRRRATHQVEISRRK